MALFEAIRERQRRNLVRKDDPRSLALRKRQGFDLSERQIGECLLCASPNAVTVMTIEQDLKSVVQGQSVSVRVDLGVRRIFKQKNNNKNRHVYWYSLKHALRT